MNLPAIIAIAASLSGYQLPAELPAIVEMPKADLYAMANEGRSMPDGARVGAAYYQGAIYLPEGFDTDRLWHQSIVAHEAVHYMQDQAGKVYSPKPCQSDAEAEAYRVQFEFLALNGVDDPYEAYSIDPWLIAKLTQCWE